LIFHVVPVVPYSCTGDVIPIQFSNPSLYNNNNNNNFIYIALLHGQLTKHFTTDTTKINVIIIQKFMEWELKNYSIVISFQVLSLPFSLRNDLFYRYIRVNFTFGLPDCDRYIGNIVISSIVISRFHCNCIIVVGLKIMKAMTKRNSGKLKLSNDWPFYPDL